MFYDCFNCHKVTPIDTAEEKCPLCGSTNGEVLTNDSRFAHLESHF